MPQCCAVLNCDYVVEAHIEDFPVCALHDMRQVRLILEKLEAPAAAWMDDRPIVYRCGIALSEEHFEPVESISGMKAADDPKLAGVPDRPSRMIHPDFDLTAP